MRAVNRMPVLALILVVLSVNVEAETRYVTSDWQVGLHADSQASSPVLKLVSAGTALEIIKTDNTSSFVRTQDGIEGWIDNSYLVEQSTAPVLSSSGDTGGDTSLEQQLKSERVRTGELQVQIAELRKHLGQTGGDNSLYEKIDQLAMEKKELEIQLARVLEGNVPEGVALPTVPDDEGFYNPRNLVISLVIALVAGVVAGLYLMDFIYRRRHGGFRI